jgi:hypothetical protein
MDTLAYILLTIYLLTLVIFLITRVKVGGVAGLITKILPSATFVIGAIWVLMLENGDPLIPGFIALGLFFGLLGDILLDLKVIYDNDKYYLNGGMLSFALGHICYFVSFTQLATSSTNFLVSLLVPLASAILITTFIMLSSKKMNLNFGDYKIQTCAYTMILAYMVVYTLILAIYGMSIVPFIGMLLFFASDIVLSFQYFGGKISNKLFIIINHLLYYFAQGTILVQILFF